MARSPDADRDLTGSGKFAPPALTFDDVLLLPAHSAILPNERTSTVAELRAGAESDTLFLLAFLNGELAGSGVASTDVNVRRRHLVVPAKRSASRDP